MSSFGTQTVSLSQLVLQDIVRQLSLRLSPWILPQRYFRVGCSNHTTASCCHGNSRYVHYYVACRRAASSWANPVSREASSRRLPGRHTWIGKEALPTGLRGQSTDRLEGNHLAECRWLRTGTILQNSCSPIPVGNTAQVRWLGWKKGLERKLPANSRIYTLLIPTAPTSWSCRCSRWNLPKPSSWWLRSYRLTPTLLGWTHSPFSWQ